MARFSSLGLSLLLFPLVAISLVTSQTNYCDSSLCSAGNTHIACQNNGAFVTSCPKDAKLVAITSDLKDLIVKAHNTNRQRVASGSTKLNKACRMATMTWNDELARVAAYNVKQCKMRHDKCRNTATYKFSGQNLAIAGTTGTINVITQLQSSVNNWFSEIDDTPSSEIAKFSGITKDPIGHFTVMVADRNVQVGCAASTYTESGWNWFLFACNYATTNMINFPIYKSCSTAGSECKTGTNSDFDSLCSVNEVYDVNKWF